MVAYLAVFSLCLPSLPEGSVVRSPAVSVVCFSVSVCVGDVELLMLCQSLSIVPHQGIMHSLPKPLRPHPLKISGPLTFQHHDLRSTDRGTPILYQFINDCLVGRLSKGQLQLSTFEGKKVAAWIVLRMIQSIISNT